MQETNLNWFNKHSYPINTRNNNRNNSMKEKNKKLIINICCEVTLPRRPAAAR